jgi:hypothetical protein
VYDATILAQALLEAVLKKQKKKALLESAREVTSSGKWDGLVLPLMVALPG